MLVRASSIPQLCDGPVSHCHCTSGFARRYRPTKSVQARQKPIAECPGCIQASSVFPDSKRACRPQRPNFQLPISFLLPNSEFPEQSEPYPPSFMFLYVAQNPNCSHLPPFPIPFTSRLLFLFYGLTYLLT